MYRQAKENTAMVGFIFDGFCWLLAISATWFTTNYVKNSEFGIPIAIYLIIINGYTMVLYKNDKWCSRQSRRWRTPEEFLILPGLVGGWIGGLFAQQLFRHKTRKWAFQLSFFISIALNIYLFYRRDDILNHISEKFNWNNFSSKLLSKFISRNKNHCITISKLQIHQFIKHVKNYQSNKKHFFNIIILIKNNSQFLFSKCIYYNNDYDNYHWIGNKSKHMKIWIKLIFFIKFWIITRDFHSFLCTKEFWKNKNPNTHAHCVCFLF